MTIDSSTCTGTSSQVEARGGSKKPGSATEGNHDDDEEVEEQDENEDDNATETPTGNELGGKSSVPCFCLLDGFFNDPESGEKSRVTIPITKLPATLGRSHDSDDPHFFGLGKKKALSRKQCRIVYRDAQGGRVQWDAVKQQLVYIDPTATSEASGDDNNADDNTPHAAHAKLTPSPKNQQLPPNGFFVVENLGKNRILVNQGRVEQGNAAVLQSGSSLRVSSYTLYFLRPLDAKPTQHVIATQQPVPLSTNKRKATPDAPLSSTKRSKVSQQHFDSLPVETLLEQMNEAIDNSLWERRHQLIGASIALHAIKEAAKDPTIQTVALNGGVSRSEIMAWVEQSPKYSNWVSQMLLKMEPRSYQAAITKCLLKAGFSRTSSSGRYIKWYLPKDTTIVVSNVNKSENTAAVSNTNNNNNNSTSNKQNSKQKSQMQKHHRQQQQQQQQQQNKGSEGIKDRHGDEDGEEQDDEEEEEEDEEGSDNEEDEKSGADDDLDHENEQENDDDNEDQDLDDQDMQDNDNSQYDDIEEGDDHPLRKSNLHEDDNDDKSSSSELDRTRPYSSSSPHHHRSRDTADNKDDDEDEDDEDDEEEQDEEEGGREDEHDNYV